MAVACSNLEPKAARKRASAGVVAFAVGLGLSWWLIAAGHPPAWRLALLPVFFFAALCLVQARHKV